MKRKEDISSIGFLNGENNTVILTPVFKGDMHPINVRVSTDEFNEVRFNSEDMKVLAIEKLNM